MSDPIAVRPAAGRRVLTPRGAEVPPRFTIDPRDPYWARALAAGDLETVSAPPATPQKESP